VDRLEILGNYFIREGVSIMLGQDAPDSFSHEDVMELVINDRKSNGETLGGAMTHQGLLLLMWIENIER
jgi:hypothetical protein